MADESDIEEIIESISEHYEMPIRLGSRCEANVYYRVEDLRADDIEVIAEHIAERILNSCSPSLPGAIISLPGSYTGLARLLSRVLSTSEEGIEVINIDALDMSQQTKWLKNTSVILVNDVITTARSCLEAHTKTTLLGATVLCWAAIIDRTFGPGPVPVIAAYTGAPVRLLEELR